LVTPVFVLGALALAGWAEFALMRAIVFHPAGGWGTPPEVFAGMLVWAALPIVASLALVSFAVIAKRFIPSIVRPLFVVACAGPAFGYIALAQYSHSTPGFMVLGYLVQLVALFVAAFKLVRTYKTGGKRNAT
jgi:hypothetical protein